MKYRVYKTEKGWTFDIKKAWWSFWKIDPDKKTYPNLQLAKDGAVKTIQKWRVESGGENKNYIYGEA